MVFLAGKQDLSIYTEIYQDILERPFAIRWLFKRDDCNKNPNPSGTVKPIQTNPGILTTLVKDPYGRRIESS